MTFFSEESRREAEALAHRSIASLIGNEGRTAVVTGAARGIGFAISHRLVESGAYVVLADLRADDLAKARDSFPQAFRARTATLEVDVTRADAVRALAETAVARTGRLDIWVNNAGIFPPSGAIQEAEDTVFQQILAVNVQGVFMGAREAARHMVGKGVILNIASIGAIRGQNGMSGYSASKHAVAGLTRSLALELGKFGIRVMAIAPGLTVSPGNAEALERVQAAGHKLASLSAPLGRIALADDVARVALFAVSDMAAMMTGQILVIDGGTTA